MTDTKDQARWARICKLFDEALKLPQHGREAFLQSECEDDAAMLSEVRSLLAADDGSGLDIENIVGRAAAKSVGEQPVGDPILNKRVGNYELVELLGSGGTSNVYLGRRIDEQFDHDVAIKVLQPGNVNQHFVERFRAERQVLANLDHPNISRLLDGGETEDGRQYLVMEYVRGEPIDSYCNTRRLDLRERLGLFQKICLAADYAHRNLVIHRDVKPSNILVSGDGEPKLLDFGIAKVLDATGVQAMTMESQRMMTPEYASPEQVRGEPVSIATDVYSLGVLLYRLLSGRGPYSTRTELPSGLMRAILDEVPSKPSTILTTSDHNQEAPSDADEISAQRRSTVARLRKRLQGDLDNIALTALRKEPERRYSTARALHDDVANYLADKPISARPDTLLYVASKFVRRNRIATALSAILCLMLVISAVQIVKQRDKAENQAETATRVSDFVVNMLASSNPYERSTEVTARALLDQGAKQIDSELAAEPLISARLKITMARAYSSLGMQVTAAELGRDALKELSGLPDSDFERADAHLALANIEYVQQDFAAAERSASSALALYGQSSTDNDVAIAMTQLVMSKVHLSLDETEKMLSVAQQAVDTLTNLKGVDDSQTNSAIANLSAIYNEMGDYDQAQALAEQVADWTAATYGDSDLLLAAPLHNIGKIFWNKGDFRGANVYYLRELDILEKAIGVNHPSLNGVLMSLAVNQRKIGYEDAAKAYYERAIAVLEESESPALGKLADSYGALGTLIMDEGHLDNAEPLIRRSLELNEQVYGVGNAETAFRLLHLGILHRKREQYDLARDYIQRSVDATLNRYEESHRNVQIMRLHLGVAEARAGRTDQAYEILGGVLASLEIHQGVNHPLTGQTLIELSEVDIATEDYATADERLVRALEIYRMHRDEWHPDIELAIRLRAQAHNGLGDHDIAATLTAEADRLRDGRERVSAEEAENSKKARF